jgi:hypothetical protein
LPVVLVVENKKKKSNTVFISKILWESIAAIALCLNKEQITVFYGDY